MITNLVKNNDGTYDFDEGVFHWTNVPEFILEEFKARDAYIKAHHIDVDKWSLKI